MIPRLRMLAGPNGSGKSTLAKQLADDYAVNLYKFLNADMLFDEIAESCLTACPFSIDIRELLDFINASKAEETQPVERFNDTVEVKVETAAVDDEFDLSDIKTTVGEPSREDIIAAAEAAAFNEG